MALWGFNILHSCIKKKNHLCVSSVNDHVFLLNIIWSPHNPSYNAVAVNLLKGNLKRKKKNSIFFLASLSPLTAVTSKWLSIASLFLHQADSFSSSPLFNHNALPYQHETQINKQGRGKQKKTLATSGPHYLICVLFQKNVQSITCFLETNMLIIGKKIRDWSVGFSLISMRAVSTVPFSHFVIVKSLCLLFSFRNNVQVVYF